MQGEYNDFELVSLAQEFNEDAIDILYRKYLPLIHKTCYRYFHMLDGRGLDFSDIMQECLLAFYEAIQFFRDGEDVCFYTFLMICMENKMVSMVRKACNEKSQILNDAVSLDKEFVDDEKNTLSNLLINDDDNPEKVILEDEVFSSLFQKIINCLSSFEECVLVLKIQDYNYKEIASILDKDEKSIDNAIQRIRFKVKELNIFHKKTL